MAGNEEERRARRPEAALADRPDEIDILGPGSLGDLAHARRPQAPAPARELPGTVASALRTARSFLGFGAAAPQASRHLADLGLSDLPADVIDDAQAMRNAGHEQAIPVRGVEPVPPRRPENLPAVVSRSLAAQGETRIVPEWHMVRHLPGYMQSQIRSLGRMVFAPFTDTPIEDIQVLSTLSNPGRDVKAVATWIFRNGIRDDEAEMDFGRIMPSYAAKTQIWNVEGYTFMVVQDFAGHYVYAWPGGRGTRIEQRTAPPRIRGH